MLSRFPNRLLHLPRRNGEHPPRAPRDNQHCRQPVNRRLYASRATAGKQACCSFRIGAFRRPIAPGGLETGPPRRRPAPTGGGLAWVTLLRPICPRTRPPLREAVASAPPLAFHYGLELYSSGLSRDLAIETACCDYATCPDWADPTDWAVERETLAALLAGHIWRYQDDDLDHVVVEQTFEIPLINPDTGPPAARSLSPARSTASCVYLTGPWPCWSTRPPERTSAACRALGP